MTGQDLLNIMEVLNQELQLQTSEADVVRGLIALNVAQDAYENMAAKNSHIRGDGTADRATTAHTETSLIPSTGMLRVDKVQMLDSSNKPIYDLDPIEEVGGHIGYATWPYQTVTAPLGEGRPTAYWTEGTLVYWAPTPDAVYTTRWYGFVRKSDITAVGTFNYDDGLALPLATFAVRLLKLGVGDDVADVTILARECFQDVIDTATNFSRESGSSFKYRYKHDA